MTYYEIVEQFKDKVDFKFMIVIDNNTMRKSYHILSNLYASPPHIVNEWLSTGNYNYKQYRSHIAKLKKVLNKKIVLHSTNNDLWHTRLIYKFKD